MGEITLIVTYKCIKDQREAFLNEIVKHGILDEILKEDGCILYKYAYGVLDADELILIERWSNSDVQQAHLARPHMQLLKEIKQRYVTDTRVETLYKSV